MSHPDPLYDPDNSCEDDEMFTEPNESDIPFVEYLYDDYNDFNEMVEDGADDFWYDEADESMDGDGEDF